MVGAWLAVAFAKTSACQPGPIHFRTASENTYLAFEPSEEPPIHGLLGHSIIYRIATGPRERQKVFTLQTVLAEPEAPRREVAESSGSSLPAGIAAEGSRRDKL
jgi:hypothetical protein